MSAYGSSDNRIDLAWFMQCLALRFGDTTVTWRRTVLIGATSFDWDPQKENLPNPDPASALWPVPPIGMLSVATLSGPASHLAFTITDLPRILCFSILYTGKRSVCQFLYVASIMCSVIKVAAVQAAPVAFDLARSIDKVAKFTLEAAGAGADLVVFP
jgi:hypothetical protein